MKREDVVEEIQIAHDTGRTVNLFKAALYSIDLSELDLSNANLSQAKMAAANLHKTKLTRSDLSNTDLTFADLRGADLRGADLSGADLREANLTDADLLGANLTKTKGIHPDILTALTMFTDVEKTKEKIRSQEAGLRAGMNLLLYTDKPNTSPFPSPILPYRWEALEREAVKRNVPLKPLIKPVPDAIRRIEKELRRIEDTGMGRMYVISGVTGAGKTTFLNSLDLFINEDIGIHNIRLRTIDSRDVVEDALFSLEREKDKFSVVILEGRENPGNLKDDELDILLATLNADFRSDTGARTLFVIPTTSPLIGERIGERAATIGGMTSPSSLHYIFEGPLKNEYFSITDGTFRALNNSRTLNDYGITDEMGQGIAQSSKSIGSFIEGCYEEIQARREELQNLSSTIKRKRIHLWMVFCSYEEDVRINYNTIRSLSVGDLQQVQVKRLLVGDSKQVRFWENKQEAFAQAALYLDLRIMYLPLRTVSSIITAYGYKELVDYLKERDLVDREVTRARAQESLRGTALGAFLQDRGFTDSDLTKRRLTEQQQEIYKEVAQFFSKDEKTFNALIAATLRDSYSQPDRQVVTELSLNESNSLIADVGVVTPTDVYCLELKWRSTVLHESEVIRQTAGRVREFAEELPELKNLLRKTSSSY